MQELIKVTSENGSQSVNARDLRELLKKKANVFQPLDEF